MNFKQSDRRHSSFKLDALVIVEIDEIVDQRSGFVNCGRKMPVDAFSLEN